MTVFVFQAFDAGNNAVTGEIAGEDEASAVRALRAKGLRVYALRTARASVRARFERAIGGRRSITFEDREEFTANMAFLLGAGVPMLKALSVLMEQAEKPAMQVLLGDIRAAIESGSTLSEALARHPREFDRLYIAMIKAGECGGVIEPIMERLSAFYSKEAALRSRVLSAMTYPAVVLAAATVVILVMVAFVVPAFEEIFTTTNAPLPAPTLILLALAKGLLAWWWLLLGAFGAAYLAARAWLRSEAGIRAWARLSLALPLLSRIRRHEITARFCRTLGTLYQSGIPILRALEICGETAANVVVSASLDEVRKLVAEGVPLGIALQRIGVMPRIVSTMILVGEESGSLEKVLERIADKYDHRVEMTVAAVLSAIEPFVIVLLGLVVGFIVAALFLPVITATPGLF